MMALRSLALAIVLSVSAPAARAAIVLQATRVIFDASNKEATMLVRNDGMEEALIQSWMASSDDKDDAPFALVPPLARIPPQSSQLLRILYEGSGLPEDRESVAWLYVQDIPRNPASENVLQLAVRHAVKVFYRPRGLKGNVADAPRALIWRRVSGPDGTAIEVTNPTSFHVSMVGIRTGDGDRAYTLADGQMIGPQGTHRFPLNAAAVSDDLLVNFTSINDYGGDDVFQVSLKPNATAYASPVVTKVP
jgi:P pilus assembly chaperone PapD